MDTNDSIPTTKIILAEEMRKKYVIKKKITEIPPIVTAVSNDENDLSKPNLTTQTTSEPYIPLTHESLAPSKPIQVLNLQKGLNFFSVRDILN